MVSLAQAVMALYPRARLGMTPADADVVVVASRAGERIAFWRSEELGAQPSPAALAAVTQAQVDAMFAARAAAQISSEKGALAAALDQALADNATYLALATPTAAQNAAQVKRLTTQMQAVLRRLAQVT